MPAWLVVLVVIAGIALVSFGYWVQTRPLAKRGRAARLTNGGRHTRSWWASLGVVVVLVVVLLAVHR